MIEFFNQWLMSVVAITLLIAVAEVLMPYGPVKEVGKLICGLLLLLTIVKPLMSLSEETLAQVSVGVFGDAVVEISDMEHYYNEQIKVLIEQELAAYILEKAMVAGDIYPIPHHISVECQLEEDGLCLPVKVELVGVSLDDEYFFRSLIGRDLGVEQVIFKEVEDENMERSSSLS